MLYYAKYAPVAQWIRASVFGTEGRTFESYRVYHENSQTRVWLFFIPSIFSCVTLLASNLMKGKK